MMPEQKPLTQKLCPMLHCSVDMHRKLLHSHPIQISLAGSILESFKLFPPPVFPYFLLLPQGTMEWHWKAEIEN